MCWGAEHERERERESVRAHERERLITSEMSDAVTCTRSVASLGSVPSPTFCHSVVLGKP